MICKIFNRGSKGGLERAGRVANHKNRVCAVSWQVAGHSGRVVGIAKAHKKALSTIAEGFVYWIGIESILIRGAIAVGSIVIQRCKSTTGRRVGINESGCRKEQLFIRDQPFANSNGSRNDTRCNVCIG